MDHSSTIPREVRDFLEDARAAIATLLCDPDKSVRRIRISVTFDPEGRALIDQTWTKPKQRAVPS